MEKDIERYMTNGVEKLGGRSLKFVSPGNSGVPDRIVLLPGGRVIFIELKTDSGIPSPLQLYWLDKLTTMGHDARILQGLSEVEAFLDEIRTA